jgi:endonuclease YncB( thermonuclease family)
MRTMPWARRRRFRNPLGAVAALVAIGVIALGVALLLPPEPALSGQASAVDGDTLRIGETRIRLIGLDAVELDQTCTDAAGAEWPCGREARSFLDKLADAGATSCTATGRDRYRRVLAHCSTHDADLGEQLVRAGWAVAELEYGLALAEARLNGRGIWAGRFDDPAEWRRNHGTEAFDLWAWLMGLFGR